MLTKIQLKGGDALLFHALKLYKLSPEIFWASGEYIWPADCVVSSGPHPKYPGRHGPARSMARSTSQRYHLGLTSDTDEEGPGVLHGHIEDSGAVRIVDAGISVISEKEMFPGKSCKERVLYITASKVEKLLISALLVVYVK